jgi:hypothetical protein
MPGTTDYEHDYIDACRSRVESQIALFQEVALAARDHGEADLTGLEGALESLEHEYFNNMLLVLDGYFIDRRPFEGEEGTALGEVRRLARSLVDDGGTVMAGPVSRPGASGSVLGLEVGDPITLTLPQYRRISDAFLREIEARYSRSGD